MTPDLHPPHQPAFFAAAFEALYLRGLGDEVTPALRQRLAALGLTN